MCKNLFLNKKNTHAFFLQVNVNLYNEANLEKWFQLFKNGIWKELSHKIKKAEHRNIFYRYAQQKSMYKKALIKSFYYQFFNNWSFPFYFNPNMIKPI